MPRELQVLRQIIVVMAAVAGLTVSGFAESPRPGNSSSSPLDTVKVVTVAMHSEMGKTRDNLERFELWCRKAREAGAKFAVFPEECLTGSLNKSTLSRIESQRIAAEASPMAIRKIQEVCEKYRMTVVVGLVESVPETGKFRNCALICGPSGLIAKYTKLWLPNRTEAAWFDAGHVLPVVQSQGWTFSVGICADINRPEYFHAAFRNGADFMLLPIAGSGGGEMVGTDGDQTKQANYHKGLHMEFLPDRARETGMYLFYANQAGKSGTDWFPGLALAVGPDGKLIDEHLPTEGMTVTTVSRAAIATARRDRKQFISEKTVSSGPLANSSGQVVRVVKVGDSNKEREPQKRADDR